MDRLYFTLRYKPGKNWLKGKNIIEQDLRAHRQYHQHLLEDNRILLGGAFVDQGEGLNILNVKTHDEAKAIAESDPAVKEGVLKAEVQPFFIVFKSENSEYLDIHGL